MVTFGLKLLDKGQKLRPFYIKFRFVAVASHFVRDSFIYNKRLLYTMYLNLYGDTAHKHHLLFTFSKVSNVKIVSLDTRKNESRRKRTPYHWRKCEK